MRRRRTGSAKGLDDEDLAAHLGCRHGGRAAAAADRRRGQLGWVTVAAGGFVLGALPGWIGDEILTGGLKGLAAALLFYAVWRRLGDARPD
jgi:hypothetical protein